MNQLIERQSEDIPVDCRHTFQPPIFGVLAESLIQELDFRDSSFEELARELLNFRVRIKGEEKRADHMFRQMLALFPLKEHLEG